MTNEEREPKKITIGQKINRKVCELGYLSVVVIGFHRFLNEENLGRASAEMGLGYLATKIPKWGMRTKRNGKRADPRPYMAAALAVPVLGATDFGSVQGKLEVGIGLLTPGITIAIRKTEERITRRRRRSGNSSEKPNT